jgi:transcriptional regulator with XRE-family HTH domain
MIKRETKMVMTGVRELARRIGCSPTLVSWVLSGKRNHDTPMGRRIMRLAKGSK